MLLSTTGVIDTRGTAASPTPRLSASLRPSEQPIFAPEPHQHGSHRSGIAATALPTDATYLCTGSTVPASSQITFAPLVLALEVLLQLPFALPRSALPLPPRVHSYPPCAARAHPRHGSRTNVSCHGNSLPHVPPIAPSRIFIVGSSRDQFCITTRAASAGALPETLREGEYAAETGDAAEARVPVINRSRTVKMARFKMHLPK